MMTHRCTEADLRFREAFESGRWPTNAFDHAAHLRLAYVYLCTSDTDTAGQRMADALQQYLAHHGLPQEKFHATLTRAWILAVAHFMAVTPPCPSAQAFLTAQPRLHDGKLMLTHYSRGRLFSASARKGFMSPDIQPIPRHASSSSRPETLA